MPVRVQRNLAEPRLSRLPGWKGVSRASGLFLQLLSAFPSFHHLIRIPKTLILHRRAPPHYHQASGPVLFFFFFPLERVGKHNYTHSHKKSVWSSCNRLLMEERAILIHFKIYQTGLRISISRFQSQKVGYTTLERLYMQWKQHESAFGEHWETVKLGDSSSSPHLLKYPWEDSLTPLCSWCCIPWPCEKRNSPCLDMLRQ